MKKRTTSFGVKKKLLTIKTSATKVPVQGRIILTPHRDFLTVTITTAWEDLPKEVLTLIFQFLPPRLLHSVGLVSKRWCSVAKLEVRNRRWTPKICKANCKPRKPTPYVVDSRFAQNVVSLLQHSNQSWIDDVNLDVEIIEELM